MELCINDIHWRAKESIQKSSNHSNTGTPTLGSSLTKQMSNHTGLPKNSIRCHRCRKFRPSMRERKSKLNANDSRFLLGCINDDYRQRDKGCNNYLSETAACTTKGKVNAEEHTNARVDQITSHDHRDEFMIDSHSSEHVINDVRLFQDWHSIPEIEIKLADGGKLLTTEKNVAVQARITEMALRNVLYISALHLGLISCSRMDEKSITTSFAKDCCSLFGCDENNYLCSFIQRG